MLIGRFAPPPSGHRHLGSIATAVGSYLCARNKSGLIFLRIEDLDTPRCKTAYTKSILEDLNLLGFRFDGQVVYQSERSDFYKKVLLDLLHARCAYYCACTRKELKISSCNCYLKDIKPQSHLAIRFKSALALVDNFYDQLKGFVRTSLDDENQLHMVLRRSDKIVAYNLACVVDDIAQGVTEIVRGSDLIDITPLQILLYKNLKFLQEKGLLDSLKDYKIEIPNYIHLPLVKMNDEKKYSKQNHAIAALSLGSPQDVLFTCLKFLNQDVSYIRSDLTPKQILDEAQKRFSIKKIPKSDKIISSLDHIK